ncbi:MAG: hypothetical protein LUG49_00900 [Oscillospiraceae bacterium]|nr:hypothetical protein [Oscillospiraceae bacterium]
MAKRLMCIIISVLMIVSLLPTGAFATENDGTEDTTSGIVLTSSDGDAGSDETESNGEGGETGTNTEDESTGTDETGDSGETVLTTASNEEETTEGEGASTEGTEATTTNVAKIGDKEYASLAEAITAASDSAQTTITLTANTTESASITVASGKNIVLDLSGYTVNMGSYTLISEGTLTIKDSTATTDPAVNTDYLTVTYTSGKIVSTGTTVCAQKGGTVTLTSGTLQSTGNIALYAEGDKTGINDVKSTVTVTGGYVVAQEYAVSPQGKGATVVISGGVIVANDNAVVGGNGTNSDTDKRGGTTITISGGILIGHIQSSGYVACGIYHPQSGTLNISGGTIVAIGGCGILMRGGTLNMTGGTIIATGDSTTTGKVGDSWVVVSDSGIIYDNYSGYYDASNVTVSLSGSVSVTAAASAITVVDRDGTASSTAVTVSGGTYSSDVTAYLSASATTTTNIDGTVTVSTGSSVATVTNSDNTSTVSYASLARAIAAASEGDTVTLLGNLTISEQLTIDKAITLDLGGYTLTNGFVNSTGSGIYRFTLITEADVTIKNGTYVTTAPETTDGVETRGIVESSGNLTLDGVTVTCNGINVCTYAEGGTLTIKDSKISGTYAVSSFANKSTVKISDSELTGSVCGLYHNGSYYGLNLTVTDTKITGGSADSSVQGATDATAVYISGSTNTTTEAGKNQQASFTGCTITGATGIEVKYTDLTLTNCTVTATGTTPTYEQYNNGSTTSGFAVVSTDNSMTGESPLPSGTISISGGTYTGAVGLASIVDTTEYTDFVEATYTIYSGTFSTNVSDYCVDGYTATAVTDSDGKTVYTVVVATAIAKIGSTTYTSLAAAFAAVADGQTITLLKDVTVEESSKSDNGLYQVNGDVTLDLNGKTLTITNKRAFGVLSGSLTIENGTIAYNASGDTTLVITRAGASFTAENVKFIAASADEGATTTSQYLVYAAAGGEVTLTDCTISNVSSAVVNDSENSATVYMKGCDFSVGALSNGSTNYEDYQIYVEVDSTSSISDDVVKVESGYIYTVNENGSVSATTTLYVKAYGQLILNGGTLSGSIVIRDGGSLEVQSGTVSNDILVEAGGKLTVSGGSVSGKITNAGTTAITSGTVCAIANTGTTTISGGTVSGAVTNSGSLTLSGGEIKSTITTSGTFTMTDGAVTVENLDSNDGAIHVTAGTINISGGTVTAEGTKARAISTAENASITTGSTISGGTFNGSNLALLVQTGTTGLTVTGGTYITSSSGLASIIDRAEAIGTGYAVFDTTYSKVTISGDNKYSSTVGDNTVIVASSSTTAVASITVGDTTTYYTTLADAVSVANAANSDTTITLLSDVGLASRVVFSNTSAEITLDLAGHKITRSGSTTSYLIGVDVGTSLVVKDSSEGAVGYIDGATYVKNDTTYIGYSILTNGELTLESGTLKGYYGVYVSGSSAEFTVEGGTVSGTTRGINQTSGTVNVKGGIISTTATASYGIVEFAGTLNVTGGEISGGYYGIQVGSSSSTSATANISGGAVTATTYYGVCNYGTLTVTGGTVSGNSMGIFNIGTSAVATIGTSGVTSNDSPKISGGASGEAIYTTNGATLTVYSGTITDTGEGGTGIVVWGDSTNDTKLYIYGGVITGHDFGISTSGNTYAGKCYIYIYGGEISGGWGMYLPAVDSETNISGGTITGEQTGIEIRAGKLTVTGGTIEGKGTPTQTTPNGSGTTATGAGIAIEQHTTKQPIEVTISGETTVVTGYTAIWEYDVQGNGSDYTKDITITISDGTFNTTSGSESSAVSIDDVGIATVAISGGTFSTSVDPEYCADGYTPTATTTTDDEGNEVTTYGVSKHYLGASTDSEGSTTSVPAESIDGYGESIMYVKVSSDYIGTTGYYSTDNYPTTSLTYTPTETVDSGSYIFAGWYSASTTTDEDGNTVTTYTAMTSFPTGVDAYAKFVEANVLTVKAQVPTDAGGEEVTSTSMRLISTVDSGNYSSVGFEVIIGSNDAFTMSSSTVYQVITALGEDCKPTSISSSSLYFITCTLTGIPHNETAYATYFKVTAFWTTLDGTKVYGAQRAVTVSEILKSYSED